MRLLLAEDEEDLSRALVTVLKHNNYSVDAVYDGAEALDYLENGDNYDGVILDIMMPKMDGITVLKTIRRHGNSVPVLLLTAKAEIDDRGGFRQWRRRLSAETIFHERASGEDPGNDKETDGHDR